MEDNAIRAISIGVMVFVFLITVTAILLYYNTAIEQAEALNTGIDYGENFNDEIVYTTSGNEPKLTGIEYRSLIRKYVSEKKKIKFKTGNIPYTIDLTSSYLDDIGNLKQQYLEKININKIYELKIEKDGEYINLVPTLEYNI